MMLIWQIIPKLRGGVKKTASPHLYEYTSFFYASFYPFISGLTTPRWGTFNYLRLELSEHADPAWGLAHGRKGLNKCS